MEAIRVFFFVFFSAAPVIHVAGGQEGLQEPEHATLKELRLTAAAMILCCSIKVLLFFSSASLPCTFMKPSSQHHRVSVFTAKWTMHPSIHF